MGILATIGAWLLSNASRKLLGDIILKMTKTDDGNIKLAEIKSNTDVALAKDGTERLKNITDASVELQHTKMNMPVFWVIIGGMMIWPFITLGAITLYNILWWSDGIWPQSWQIAAYPPSIAPWVEKSIDWLYNPLGTPVSVASAVIASKIAGRKQLSK